MIVAGHIRLAAARNALAERFGNGLDATAEYRSALRQLGMRLHQHGGLHTALAARKAEPAMALEDVLSVSWDCGSSEHFSTSVGPPSIGELPNLIAAMEQRALLEAEMLAAVAALVRILEARRVQSPSGLPEGKLDCDEPLGLVIDRE